MKQRHIGVIILLIAVVIGLLYTGFEKTKPEEKSITGYLGGEKIGLYESEEFKSYIKDNYGLEMNYKKAGSLDMVKGDVEEEDYLFPSSQLALELYKQQGKPMKQNEIIFNSPIVIYSRKPVVNALEKEGIVNKKSDTYYINMTKLADIIIQEKSWADLGLPEIYGNVLVDTTDPNKSNSGNMFLGLLANSINGGKVVDSISLQGVKPKVQKIYNMIGYMQSSSADMFSQFLKLGVGAYPLIAGYESQILEFSKLEPETYSKIKDDIYILYPEPTVWSSHVYIALNDDGVIGLNALMDPKIQEMAWNPHGYRTVVAGTESISDFIVPGLAKDVVNVMPTPGIDEMLELMKAVE